MKNFLGGGYKLSKILIGVSVLVIIGTVIVGKVTHAGFKSSISVPLANGKITYKHPDFSLVGLYVENDSGNYVEASSVPSGNYEVNGSKTYCTKPSGTTQVNDSNVKVTYSNNLLNFNGVGTKNTKCYVYLDKEKLPINVSEVLAKYTKDNSRSGSITAAFKGNTPNTIYSKEDDDGTSYVFAGVNPNNWVKLGNIYFRIIRFNGDGSMRLIFSGDGSPATSGTETEIGTNRFNATRDNNETVGLKYTMGQVHGSTINSIILGESTSTDITTLYGWYNIKIKPSYSSIIDTNVGFCSDREPSTDANISNGSGGTGIIDTFYRAYITYVKGNRNQYTYNPVLKCKNNSDLFKLPVGLITADEYALAGGGINNGSQYYNTEFWLHTGEYYWAMTPNSYRSGSHTQVFTASSRGFLASTWVDLIASIRPVINLKSTTQFLGGDYDGTETKPWTVKI